MARVQTIVFLSLVLDLFAFTIPLPLFPRIIEWYTKREASDPTGFLSQTLHFVQYLRSFVYDSPVHSERWDVVLLGGLMGSVFSTLQFIVSPFIGSLSDKYGRKKILLITMIGNIASAIIWIQSTTFASYMLSRVVGGLSEGNVQLAIAILSDVSTPAQRSSTLAYVGIAFAICFCIGPPIGAYFASASFPHIFSSIELNIYAVPAALTLVLLLVETAFIYVALPETRGKGLAVETPAGKGKTATGKSTTTPTRPKTTVEHRLSTLARLRRQHFLFLCLFSGVEFTLTFLTFDLFDWTNKQNGALIGSIGIISALLQGGYVRRAMSKTGEGKMARRGVHACALALVLLALLPNYPPETATRLLQGAAVCLAFTSATVVNALTAAASLQCDEGKDGKDAVTGKPVTDEHPDLAKGKALGRFRSRGQLGRAIGPLLACAMYWTFGPTLTYSVCAVAMFALAIGMRAASKRAL
uniref:Major facilitator superfamily (MFS) profile domain-containing protein n=1 Tax=Schizophyllum commune (strain H4-8 / FGSC 9210) TaxID=578458 RepID=D8PPJ3_SCHCM